MQALHKLEAHPARCHQKGSGVVPCGIKSATSTCSMEHHKSLHLSKSEYCQAPETMEASRRGDVVKTNAGVYIELRCPVCKGQHNFIWASGKVRHSSRLLGCKAFENSTLVENGRMLEEVGE